MKRKLQFTLLLFCLITLQGLRSQEKPHLGTHQEQLAQFGIKDKALYKSSFSAKDIIPLQQNQAKGLKKIVFGFLPDWEYNNGAHNNMHYELLSHIAVFNFLATSDGNLSNPAGWPWNDVINKAHTNGTKVIMAVTNFGGSEDSDIVAETIMTNSTSKNNFFNKVKNIITTYKLDGVNIDFEGLKTDYRGDIVNTFMGELSTYIHTNLPGKEVSFDGPAVNWGSWKLEGLAASVDHLFIMAYDYNGSWSKKTGAVSPLTCSSGKCITTTLNSDYAAAKAKYPEKLILGVPYYGKQWEANSNSAGATVIKYIGSTFYRDDVINASNHGGYLWDTASQTSWYRWQSGSIWNQVWSDNENSLSKKYDLALSQALGGVGIWALNYDAKRSELWDLINQKFNGSLAVDDSFIKTNLTLYPNPTNGVLKISNPNVVKIGKIEIFNMYGQRMALKKQEVSVDLSKYSSGIYFVRVEDAEGNQGTFKVIKD